MIAIRQVDTRRVRSTRSRAIAGAWACLAAAMGAGCGWPDGLGGCGPRPDPCGGVACAPSGTHCTWDQARGVEIEDQTGSKVTVVDVVSFADRVVVDYTTPDERQLRVVWGLTVEEGERDPQAWHFEPTAAPPGYERAWPRNSPYVETGGDSGAMGYQPGDLRPALSIVCRCDAPGLLFLLGVQELSPIGFRVVAADDPEAVAWGDRAWMPESMDGLDLWRPYRSDRSGYLPDATLPGTCSPPADDTHDAG